MLHRVRAQLVEVSRAELSLIVVGVTLSLIGIYAMFGSLGSTQGELLLLLIAGLALVAFGVMIAMRWNLSAAKTGLIGLTAGYFATALSEFEVATDPCDVGGTLERCATDVVKGAPWVVYQGPMLLAVLAFALIVLEPLVTARTSPRK